VRFADQYGFYELNPFPGCNQICVSNHSLIYRGYRGEGRGQIQHQERLIKAKELGYDFIQCTVRGDNLAEKHILNKYNWSMMASFKSKETGNLVELWGRLL
jgi:hypothetical protein